MRLAGKTAVVTAAAAGIGRACALAFAREGATVIATDIDTAGLATLAAEHAAIRTERLDVADRQAVERVRAGAPRADILLNAAGYVHHGTILDCDDREWNMSFDVNVRGMFHTIQAWLPGMVERGGGSIINIASVVSSLNAMPNRSVYATTKAAVIGLTKSVASDFARSNVRSNAICPGSMDSPSFAERLRGTGDEQARRKAIGEIIPLGRVGALHEPAALAVYLASDESGYTTGQTHIIDGGWKL